MEPRESMAETLLRSIIMTGWVLIDGFHANPIKVIKSAINESEFCFVKLADRCENYGLAAI